MVDEKIKKDGITEEIFDAMIDKVGREIAQAGSSKRVAS